LSKVIGKEKKEILTFEKLSQELKALGKEGAKEIAPDTTAYLIDEYSIGVKVYSTVVIKIYADNTYELSMLFPTSKILDVFNKFSPACVVLKDLKFFILRNVSGSTRKENLVPFYNSITVDSNGDFNSINIEGKV
jgi:hypothetical protein